MTFPITQETYSRETNEVAGVGGTFTDAAKLNAVYTLLEQMQLTYGLSGDASSPTGSHTGQIKYLLAQSGGITQSDTAPGAPADGDLWLKTNETPAQGVRRYEVDDTAWHLVGADALQIAGRAIDLTDTPADGDAITWDNAASKWKYTTGSSSGHTIKDEGSALTARANLNFVGAGVTVSDDSGANATVVTIPQGYVTVEQDALAVAQRQTLNFTGAGVAVADSGGKTLVTISGTGLTVQEEGVAVTARAILNFTGSSVSAVDNSGASRTDVTIVAYDTIKDAGGSALTQRNTLKFAGTGVSVADVGSETVATITAGGGHTIQDEGTSRTARTKLNFVGAGVTATDDAGNDATVVTIPGAGTLTPTVDIAGTRDQTFLDLAITNVDNAGQYAQFDVINRESGPVNSTLGRIRWTTEASYKGKAGFYVGDGVSPAAPKLMLELQGTADIVSLPRSKVAINGVTYTWPSGAITAGSVLSSDASGVLSWSTSGSAGHTVQDEGTPLTARSNLNFVGAGVAVTDDSGNDATVVTISGGGGGGSGWAGVFGSFSAPPAASTLTWINQGTSTRADDTSGTDDGLLLVGQGGADSLRILLLPTGISGDKTLTVAAQLLHRGQNNTGVGILFTDANSGTPKCQTLSVFLDGNGVHKLQQNDYTNPTTYSTTNNTDGRNGTAIIWLRLRDDGATNKVFSYSYDGANWVVIRTVSRTNFLTPAYWGVFANAGGGASDVPVKILSVAVT